MGLAPVRIGPGQEHEHLGPGREGAPGLDPVDQPAALGGRGRSDHAGHVGAEVGLGDGHRPHHLSGGQLGQPADLLLLGPAVHQGPGEDFRPGDERPAGAERPPGQLLGGHHHAHVVGLAPGGEAAVLLGDRHAEATHLGHASDDLLGYVGVGPVYVLGPGSDLLGGETVERLPHQFEVGVQVAGAGLVGQGGHESRVPELGRPNSREGSAQSGATPQAAVRPKVRVARSATASATKAQAMRASVSPWVP